MKKHFTLIIIFTLFYIIISDSLIFASWIKLTLDGRFSYDDNHNVRGDDTGANTSQSLNLTYEFPMFRAISLKGALGFNEANNITSETRSFRLSANLTDPLFSASTSHSEDDRGEHLGGGATSTRNDFNAAFTPKERFLPQLRYSFGESDSDLGGASNSFDFKISERMKPSEKIAFDFAYSMGKNMNVLAATETMDQRFNARMDSSPFTNIKLGISKDFGLSDSNTSAPEPQVETMRTAYDVSINPFKNVKTPLKDVIFGWKRSEDFSTASSELRVSSGINASVSLKPFNKVDLKYDYSTTIDEKDSDVGSTSNSGQSLNVVIPIFLDVDLRYVYNLRKNIDTLGLGTNSEDNGFTLAYKSPVLKGTSLTLDFTYDTDSRQVISDTETRQQNNDNWGIDGRAYMFKMLDITFSHRVSLTKSTNYVDDQESVNDGMGTSLKYNILQLINGTVSAKYSSRSSNARTQTSEANDRNYSNSLDYKTGNLNLGLTNSYTETEADNVTSKTNIAPTLSYGLSKGRLSLRYSISNRVDEDPVTGDLTSSRDANYDIGFNYNITTQTIWDIKYSARNHIDFGSPEGNDDSDRMSTSLSFKF